MKTAAATRRTHAAGTATMRAVVQDVYGDTADVLRLAEVARPEPATGEVLVRVAAAGVDRGRLAPHGRQALRRAAGASGCARPATPCAAWSSRAGSRPSATA